MAGTIGRHDAIQKRVSADRARRGASGSGEFKAGHGCAETSFFFAKLAEGEPWKLFANYQALHDNCQSVSEAYVYRTFQETAGGYLRGSRMSVKGVYDLCLWPAEEMTDELRQQVKALVADARKPKPKPARKPAAKRKTSAAPDEPAKKKKRRKAPAAVEPGAPIGATPAAVEPSAAEPVGPAAPTPAAAAEVRRAPAEAAPEASEVATPAAPKVRKPSGPKPPLAGSLKSWVVVKKKRKDPNGAPGRQQAMELDAEHEPCQSAAKKRKDPAAEPEQASFGLTEPPGAAGPATPAEAPREKRSRPLQAAALPAGTAPAGVAP